MERELGVNKRAVADHLRTNYDFTTAASFASLHRSLVEDGLGSVDAMYGALVELNTLFGEINERDIRRLEAYEIAPGSVRRAVERRAIKEAGK